LKRLNAESVARTKRQRRRANEVKTRAIQRMQLQMIVPLDIGMEQHDAALGLGQEDVFDLGRTENGLRKNSSARFLTDNNGDLIVESDEEDGDEQDRDVETMDLEEEREEKLRDLEVELDGLYDAYQGRLRERDAKFKVNESRRKNAEREEWNGIQPQASDGSESEEGEWDGMQDVELNDSDSSSDSDSEDTSSITGCKRKRSENVVTNSKRQRLITNLKQPTSGMINTAAQVWFSQDVFTGLEDLNSLSDSDGADNIDDDDTLDDNEDEENVSTFKYIVCSLSTTS
jgi:AdoMet-dependent rRNA methyltransferase SPB1